MLEKISQFILMLIFTAISLSSMTTAFADKPLNFEIVPIHYGLLKGEPFTENENNNTTKFRLVSNAKKGDSQFVLTGAKTLHPSELIVYRSKKKNYYVAQVKEVRGQSIFLEKPLKADINKGYNVWNFYKDHLHPNKYGFNAVADYALSYLKKEKFANKVHGFAGDSWFDNNYMVPRFASKLKASHIINKGVYGRKTSDVLAEFDEEFPVNAAVKPDYIWILLGTNDYWNKVSSASYLDNMKKIIKKVNNLGAKALVFTPSVGSLVHDPNAPVGSGVMSPVYFNLSNKYADDLLSLHAENQIGAYTENKNLIIELTATQKTNNDYHYVYFLDTDNKLNTGHKIFNSKWGETGLDYLVSDGEVYQSLTNNSNWNWQYKNMAVSATNNKVVVSKSSVGLASSAPNSTIKVGLLVFSKDWSKVVDYYPKTNKMQKVIINKPPAPKLKAVNDTVSAISGATITIDVLANDTGSGLNIGWFDAPANGTVQLSNKKLVYKSNPGFTGVDSFWYEARDALGHSEWANILVTVTPAAVVLKANDDTATLHSGKSVLINVLANDKGNNISLEAVDLTWTGTISIIGNKVKYQSDGSYKGKLVTWYGITDSNGDISWAKLTINIIQ